MLGCDFTVLDPTQCRVHMDGLFHQKSLFNCCFDTILYTLQYYSESLEMAKESIILGEVMLEVPTIMLTYIHVSLLVIYN